MERRFLPRHLFIALLPVLLAVAVSLLLRGFVGTAETGPVNDAGAEADAGTGDETGESVEIAPARDLAPKETEGREETPPAPSRSSGSTNQGNSTGGGRGVPNRLQQIPVPTGSGVFRFARIGAAPDDSASLLPRSPEDTDILAVAVREDEGTFAWYLSGPSVRAVADQLLILVDHLVLSREPEEFPGMNQEFYRETIRSAAQALSGNVDLVEILGESPDTLIVKIRNGSSWLFFRLYREGDIFVDMEYWRE